MSAPAFTPGPWSLRQPPQAGRRVMMPDDCIEVRAPDEQGGMVACLYAENRSADGDVDQANARLIAAAPELYEALESLCNGMDELDQAVNRETYTAARAALAKAREQ